MVEVDVKVRCADGRTRPYVNLDYAASTPAIAGVLAIVQDFTTWYGSDDESELGTAAYEAAHGAVAEFVGARDGTVVLVRNTAEATAVLAAALPAGTRVLTVHGRAAVGRARRRRPAGARQRRGAGGALRARVAGRAIADRPRRGPRRLERHRRGLAAGRARGGRAPLRREALRRRHAARLPSRHRHGRDRASTTWRCRATCSTRRSGAPRSSPAVAPWRTTIRFAQRGGCGRPRRGLPDAGRGRDGPRGGARARPAGAPRGGSGERPRPAVQQRCATTRPSTASALATFELEGYRPRCWPRSSAPSTRSVWPRMLLRAPLLRTCSVRDSTPARRRARVRVELRLATTAQDVDRLVDALAEIARTGPRWGYVHDRAHDEYRPAPEVRALPRRPRYEPAAASASARPLRS